MGKNNTRIQQKNQSENIMMSATDPKKEILQRMDEGLRMKVSSRLNCREAERAEIGKKRQVFKYKRRNVSVN